MTIQSLDDALAVVRDGLPPGVDLSIDGRRHLEGVLQGCARTLLADPHLEEEARRNMATFGVELWKASANGALGPLEIQQLCLRLCPLFPICK
jgi:hypothetical protein